MASVYQGAQHKVPGLSAERKDCLQEQEKGEQSANRVGDLRRDPPPDLVVEIDVTHSSLDRMAIYAALRVPEVWCFDGKSLRVYLLASNGHHVESERSHAFPFLPLAELARFLQLRSTLSETELVRQFRSWVRERIAAGWR